MYDHTKLVSQKTFAALCQRLPTVTQKKRGRKRIEKSALVNGILQVLVNGVSWQKIAPCGASATTCWRYFQEIQRRGKLKLIHHALAQEKTDLHTSAIDTTLVCSFKFSRMTGYNGQRKATGTKVSLFADHNGVPVDVAFGKGNVNDKNFILDHLKQTVGKVKKILNLDMSYMSLSLRRALRQKGIRVNMKWRSQDFQRKRGPKFLFDEHIYAARWM